VSRFEVNRRRMVEQQLERARKPATPISDPRVLAAMTEVPRHLFVPEILQRRAYEDGPLPISKRQTISQPWIVARMTELLGLTGDEKVLEIGTGSGYQAAVLSMLCRQVITVERHGELAKDARRVLEAIGARNVTVLAGDGTMGRSEFAPYDAVLVTAASPSIPSPLVNQLVPGGVLVLPVGSRESQTLVRVRRDPDGEGTTEERFAGCRFVPLLGRFGWKENA
jgi:protein-L-isoaspartate(D-aspartate) O-methyltransferase